MLGVLGSIYGKIADLRNRFYDRGIFDTFDLGARTISVGNLTAGGTGKTPLVAYIAGILAARGERVCILTRGYGRQESKNRVLVSDGEHVRADAEHSGDEPFELAQKLLGKAIVIADADRVGAGEWAGRRFGVTVFVLDDGFQHRRVKRDVDIVCIDATDPFGGGRMLPAGRLREPVENLKRADIIVITRSNLVNDITDLRSAISDLNEQVPIFVAKGKIVNTASLDEFHPSKQLLQTGKKSMAAENGSANSTGHGELPALAFCAIGNPGNFFDQLKQDGFRVALTQTFRDHHVYTQQDIDRIEKRARESGTRILLTTAKDAVKLTDLRFEIPCFVAEVDLTIDCSEEFAGLIVP